MSKKRWQGGSDDAPQQPQRPKPNIPPKSSAAGGGASGRGEWKRQSPTNNKKADSATVKFLLGILGLVFVGTLLLVILMLLNPVPPMQLAVMTARYRVPLLDPNSFALHDASSLAAQKEILDTSRADVDSQSRTEMVAQVAGLANLKPHRFWFSWEKTTAMAYVNAMGIAIWDSDEGRAVPFLLPDDFEVPLQNQPIRDLRAIPIAEILHSLASSPADQKILVLDCQRMDHSWPIGSVTNEFVEATLAELDRLDPKEREGLYVLFSCSPGEVTWVDNVWQHSPFGYFFLRGLTGAADRGTDRDGRVSLNELHQYVRDNVRNWARENRADTQTPFLYPQDAPDVPLVAANGSSEYKIGAATREEFDPAEALQNGWREYYALLQTDPSPIQYAPHLVRYLQDSLMRSEAFWLAGDIDAVRDELRGVEFRIDDLHKARADYAIGGRGYSLAMDSFLAASNPPVVKKRPAIDAVAPAAKSPPATGDDNKGENKPDAAAAGEDAKPKGEAKEQGTDMPDAKPTPAAPPVAEPNADMAMSKTFASIVEEVSRGDLSIPMAAQKMRSGILFQQTPPIEAHLIGMLADHFYPRFPGGPSRGLEEQARSIITLRLQAEQAAIPAGNWAPDVFRWVRPRLGQADQTRRLRTDRIFASEATPIQIRLAEMPSPTDPLPLYERARSDAERVARAVQLRQQLLSELPFYTALVAQRTWQRADAGLMSEVQLQTDKLVAGTQKLSQLVGTDLKSDLDQATLDQTIDEMDMLSATLQRTRDELVDRLVIEARELGQTKGSPRTQNDWRRIADILTVPVMSDPRDAEESARVRVNLVARLRQGVQQAGTATADQTNNGGALGQFAAMDAEARTKRAIRLATLANQYYAIGTGEPVRFQDKSAGEAGGAIGRAWRQLVEHAMGTSVDLEQFGPLFQAETARRLLNGYLAKKGEYSYVNELRRLNLSRLFAWQASRFADDFWAGATGENEPYFLRTARGYLDRADSFDPRQGRRYAPLREHLQVLAVAASQLRVEALPPKVSFRGTDEETVRLGVPTSSDFPSGIGTLWSHVGSSAIEVRQLPTEQSDLPFRFQLFRRGTSGESSELAAKALYRGHVAQRSIPIQLSNDEEGPTVVYIDRIQGANPKYSVQLAQGERSDQKILFVLDCSASMAAGNRMGIMKSVLQKFAEETPEGSVDVGIRLLGDTVVWDNEHPEAEAAARRDSQNVLPIGPFNRQKFEAIVTGLRPVGATPLFRALIDGKKDFDDVPGGRKTVIAISDGADNWVAVGQKPGFDELRSAYQGTGITLNTIGFLVKDAEFDQLRQVAQIGGGKVARAEDAEKLLSDITGLLNFMKFSATSAGKRYPDPAATLKVAATPVTVFPGLFDVEVFASDGTRLATRPEVRMFAGQSHFFDFKGDKIDYASTGFPAGAPSAEDAGAGVAFVVSQAKPTDGGLDVVCSLFKPKDAEWRPNAVSIIVRAVGTDRFFTFQNLPANVPGYHLPVWNFTIEEWPTEASDAEIEVRWVDPSSSNSPAATGNVIGWNDQALGGKIPAGVKITQRQFGQRTIQGKVRNAAKVKIAFPPDSKDFQLWSIALEPSVIYARQIYNDRDNVYTGEFILEGEKKPESLLLYPPRPSSPGSILKLKVPVKARTLN